MNLSYDELKLICDCIEDSLVEQKIQAEYPYDLDDFERIKFKISTMEDLLQKTISRIEQLDRKPNEPS